MFPKKGEWIRFDKPIPFATFQEDKFTALAPGSGLYLRGHQPEEEGQVVKILSVWFSVSRWEIVPRPTSLARPECRQQEQLDLFLSHLRH